MTMKVAVVTIRLVLVTHASTSATTEARFPAGESLDSRGASLASSAAGGLRRMDRVLRGPEARCAQTARALGFSATTDPSLADLDVGVWQGRALGELPAEEVGVWLSEPDAAPHGGESLAALFGRVGSWLDGLGEVDGGPGRVLAVTHPAVVRAAVLRVLGAPLSCFWRLDSGPLTQTWFSHHGGRWQIRETGHSL